MTLPAGLNDRHHQSHREPTGRSGEVAVAVVGPDGSPAGAVGASSGATGQVSVANTATQIVAARATRREVLIVQGGTTDVYIGYSSGVTTATGVLLPGSAGAALTLKTTSAVYGIVASGTDSVCYAEEYD